MKFIPKDVNFEHIMNDKTVRNIIKNSNNKDAKSIIDQMTRKYLRGKYPTKVIEGQERIQGVGVVDVWYNYS